MESKPNMGTSQAADEQRALETTDREVADRKAFDNQSEADKSRDADTRTAARTADENRRAADRRSDMAKDAADRKAADRRADDRRSDALQAGDQGRYQTRDLQEDHRHADQRHEPAPVVEPVSVEGRLPSMHDVLATEDRDAEDRPIMRPHQDKPLWARAVRHSEESGPGSKSAESPVKASTAADRDIPSYVQRARDRNAGFIAANEAAGRTMPSERAVERANQHEVALERAVGHHRDRTEARQPEHVLAEEPVRSR